jgi:hypothetical protein
VKGESASRTPAPHPAGPPAEPAPDDLIRTKVVNVAATGPWRHARADRPLHEHSLWALVNRAVSAVIGRPVHSRTLRHSFPSRLRENAAPLELISEALGHASLSTTLIHATISTLKRRADLTGISRHGRTTMAARRGDGISQRGYDLSLAAAGLGRGARSGPEPGAASERRPAGGPSHPIAKPAA